MKRVMLFIAASYGAIAFAGAAQAQTTPSPEPTDAPAGAANGQPGPGEVIVTARRRAENLQDVPISITAVSGAALTERGVRDALDLQYQTPSLTVTTNGASRASVSYSIRGQRTNEVQLLTDPPVGTYFAEVVEPRTYGFGTAFYDLQNVQILKGVQGTLFGRNMTGGAVLVEPAHPDLSGAHAEAMAQYGNYNLRDVTGMINLPVIADTLAVRAAGTYRARDGFTTDVSTGRKYDDQNYYAFRLSSTLKLGRFESYTIFDYVKESENGTALKLIGYSLFDPINGQPTVIAQQIGASPFFPVAAGAPPQNLIQLFNRDLALPNYQVAYGGAGSGVLSGTTGDPFNTVKNWGITNKTTFQAGSVTFKNIFGYRKIDYVNHSDYDGSEAALILPIQVSHTSNYSEEFQMQGTPFGSRFNLTAGIYFFQEEGRDGSIQSTFPQLTAIGFASNPRLAPLAGYFLTQAASAYNQSTFGLGLARSYAAYEAGTYTLTDQIKISGGIRYNNDLRRATVNPFYPNLVIPGLGGPGLCLYNGLGAFSSANCPHTRRLKNEAITWDATLQYEPTRDLTAYISTRRGYRSGGFSLRATDDTTFAPFQPETVQEFEAGLKNRFDLGGARLNTSLAIYYQNYKNVQKQNSFIINSAIETIVTNTAQQHNYGGEAEANLTLPGGLGANIFYSYIRNKVVRGDNGSFAMQGVPTHQLGGGLSYNHQLDVGELNANVNATYRSLVRLDDYDVLLTQRAYALVNGRIALNSIGGSGFGAAVFVNNLTNKYYIVGGISLVSGGPVSPGPGFGAATVGEPRTFGGEISFKF